jgi:hypothetical protein
MEHAVEIQPNTAQVAAVVSPFRRRKRGKKLPAHAFDRRTRMGRRAVQLAATFNARLGEDAGDLVLQVQVERAAQLVAYSEVLSARALRADPAVCPDDVVRLTRLADISVRRLNLDRHKRRLPRLPEYLEMDEVERQQAFGEEAAP